MSHLQYILQEQDKIPRGYKPLSLKILAQNETEEETRITLRSVKAHAIQGGQDVIFRKSGLDYEVFVNFE